MLRMTRMVMDLCCLISEEEVAAAIKGLNFF